MKKIFILIVIILIMLSSCQITERIYINDDGSGTFELEVNMNEMLNSLSGIGEQKIDSVAVVKDSIIYFSDLLKGKEDSIAKLSKEDKKYLKMLKGMKLKIHEDKANSEMVLSYIIDFKDVKELAQAQDAMSMANKIGEKKSSENLPSKTNMIYKFKRNKFKRKSVAKKFSKKQQINYDAEIEKMNVFMEGSFYNIEYHFPRAVKKFSNKNSTLSDDKKTVYLKLPMIDALENPKKMDLKVILEKK